MFIFLIGGAAAAGIAAALFVTGHPVAGCFEGLLAAAQLYLGHRK